MDTTKISQNNISYEEKRNLYSLYFSSDANTTCSYKDKIELYTLICYLSQILVKIDPIKYPNTLTILNKIFESYQDKPNSDYIEALSIVCDDLKYGVGDIDKPGDYKNVNEIVTRIQQLVEQWMPF